MNFKLSGSNQNAKATNVIGSDREFRGEIPALEFTLVGADEAPVTYAEHRYRSDSADLINSRGSENDDFIVGGTVDNGRDVESTYNGHDIQNVGTINGGAGYDTLILHGDRADFLMGMLVDPSDYPQVQSSDWDNNSHLYGKILVIENVETGDSYRVSGVENIIFDPNKLLTMGENSTPIDSGILPTAIEEGSVKQVSFKELISDAENNMGPEQVERARMASTKAAADLLNQTGDIAFKTAEQAEVDNDFVIQSLKQSGLDTTEIMLDQELADVPKSPESLAALNVDLHEIASKVSGFKGPGN